MSLEMIDRFIALDVPTTERFVGLLLGNHHNGQTGRCDPSTARLAQESGLSRRAVELAVQRLEQGGHITVKRVTGTRNSYRLHPQNQPDPRTSCACERHSQASGIRKTCEPPSHPPANVLRRTCEPASHEPELTGIRTGKEPEDAAAQPPKATRPPGSFSSHLEDGKDFTAACETEIGPNASALITTAWAEWQQYRQRRHRARGAARLLWTAQAARLSAGAILDAAKEHGGQLVAARITAAISGEWKGLNFDKMTPASPRGYGDDPWNSRDRDHAPDPDSELGF